MATDLQVEQGATLRVTLAYTDSQNNAVDLTGYKARMQVRQRANLNLPVLFELNTENGGLTLDGPGGHISILMKASQTELLRRNAVYDLRLIDSADPDNVAYVIGGSILVTPAVTALA